MQCELCGRECESKQVVVEGTMMNVCGNCSKFGEAIPTEKLMIPNKYIPSESKRVKDTKPEESSDEIVSDFYERIKKAREKKELTQDKLAEAIAEKGSLMHSIEVGRIKPSLKVAKKLEQFLNIKLIGDIETTENSREAKEKLRIDLRNKNLTIGDLIKLKKELR